MKKEIKTALLFRFFAESARQNYEIALDLLNDACRVYKEYLEGLSYEEKEEINRLILEEKIKKDKFGLLTQ